MAVSLGLKDKKRPLNDSFEDSMSLEKFPRTISPEIDRIRGKDVSPSSLQSQSLSDNPSINKVSSEVVDQQMASIIGTNTPERNTKNVNTPLRASPVINDETEEEDNDVLVFDRNIYLTQSENRYTSESCAPYIVYLIDSDADANIGNICGAVIGKEFRRLGIKVKAFTSSGPEKLVIHFYSPEEANAFVETGIHLLKPSWRAIIPNSSIFKVGIVHRFPTEFSEEDFWSGLDENSKELIVKVEFMKKRVEIERNGTKIRVFQRIHSIKIFAKTRLPEGISMFEQLLAVDKFIPKVKRCFYCQRFGHISSNCDHPIRCLRCGENHNVERCQNEYRCVNCGGDHLASYQRCIIYCFNLEVLELKTIIDSNIRDATLLVAEKFRTQFNIIINEAGCVSSIEDENRYHTSKALQSLADFEALNLSNPPPNEPIGNSETCNSARSQVVEEINKGTDNVEEGKRGIEWDQQTYDKAKAEIVNKYGPNSEAVKVFERLKLCLLEGNRELDLSSSPRDDLQAQNEESFSSPA